jgi:hypothetical protein
LRNGVTRRRAGSPRLLDLLRNADEEDNRSDLILAQD